MATNRDAFLEELNRLANEYADEADHQDGRDYWVVGTPHGFESVQQIVADFVMYLFEDPATEDFIRRYRAIQGR